VVFLREGRIDDQGSHAELLARNSGYAHLVNAYEQERPDPAGPSGGSQEVGVP
jgi:ATP-binding cassette, subfamily B, bacterial